jgi:conjugative transfer region protein TrbK
MDTKMLDRLLKSAAVVLIVLVIAACTVHLRDGEDQAADIPPMDQAADPLAAKLAECRSVTYEQKVALAECRKAWAEKRRQFLRQGAPEAVPDSETPRSGSSLFAPPKDGGRVPLGLPPIPQSKE